VNLLLDTHTLIWFLNDHPFLSPRAKSVIEHPENESFVSIASLWEIAIKVNIGKLDLGARFKTLFPAQLEVNGFIELPVNIEHLYALERLPLHHRDPFDRLIIAQAQVEGLSLVSRDPHFDAYGLPLLW
jgi:PIN domain nuclease of toxin-antitoxin system